MSMTYTMDTISSLFPKASKDAIRKAIRRDGLPARKIGKEWFFDADAVRAWLSRQSEQAAHQARKVAVKAAKDRPENYPDVIGD